MDERAQTEESEVPFEDTYALEDGGEGGASHGGSVSRAAEDRYIGLFIGHLRLESQIGSGGFGAVYRAIHQRLGTPFAVKVLHAHHISKTTMVKRFDREARLIAQLSHPHVVRVSDFGQLDDGSYYLVMEFLHGKPLDEWFKQQNVFSLSQLRMILRQLCSAVDYIHGKGIVHRDLKPANIFIEQSDHDNEPHCKLLDFGIAGFSEEPTLTKTGAVIGSPLYMAPEQVQGNAKSADGRADIYSLGVILYQLLVGVPPFVAEDMMQLMYQHMLVPPQPLTEVRPELDWSPGLEALLMRALEKVPDQRFSSMGEFQEALEEALADQGARTPEATFPLYFDGDEPARRHTPLPSGGVGSQSFDVVPTRGWTWWLVVGLIGLCGAVLMGGLVWFVRTSSQPKPTTRADAKVARRQVPQTRPRPTRAPARARPVKRSAGLVSVIVVTSTPPKATLWWNGEKVGRTPQTIRGLPGTAFLLRLRTRGYQTRIHRGRFSKTSKATLRLSLRRNRRRAAQRRSGARTRTPPRRAADFNPFPDP